MTLELEKIVSQLHRLVQHAHRRQQWRQQKVAAELLKMSQYATDWETIEARLNRATASADHKYFRAARPLDDDPHSLDARIPAPGPPCEATVIATDGSQILPDHHGAFLYYLINVGGFVYHHGQGRSPSQFIDTEINYPDEISLAEAVNALAETDNFVLAGGIVHVRRDIAEIQTLARAAEEYAMLAPPVLAIVDQRLLYWPFGADMEARQAVDAWQAAMSRVNACGALLAGYVARSSKSSVVNLLHVLDIDKPGFDVDAVTKSQPWQRLQDIELFAQLLKPGERSKVFVDVSPHNENFRNADPDNEVCFFYFNPGGMEGVARVDIPMWVAREPASVDVVHGLISDQCRIMGDYPYVLTRADEIAVVGRRDQAELDARLELMMERQGVAFSISAKQQHKGYARAGRTRHEV